MILLRMINVITCTNCLRRTRESTAIHIARHVVVMLCCLSIVIRFVGRETEPNAMDFFDLIDMHVYSRQSYVVRVFTQSSSHYARCFRF